MQTKIWQLAEEKACQLAEHMNSLVQGTTSGRLDTYYGAGRLGGAPGHLMKTIVPKAEDATASVYVRPVQDTSAEVTAASQANNQHLPLHFSNSSYSSTSSGMPCSTQMAFDTCHCAHHSHSVQSRGEISFC